MLYVKTRRAYRTLHPDPRGCAAEKKRIVMSKPRPVKAPTGTGLNAKSWLTEAPLRMLMNNLDPDVAERPDDLVVYGGIGKAARNWACFDAIVDALKSLGRCS